MATETTLAVVLPHRLCAAAPVVTVTLLAVTPDSPRMAAAFAA